MPPNMPMPMNTETIDATPTVRIWNSRNGTKASSPIARSMTKKATSPRTPIP